MKPSKYRNIKVEYDDIHFDSKRERDRYQALKLLERAGEIRDLILQPAFPLIVSGHKIGVYRGDFQYTECASGEQIVEDVKSQPTKTPVYRLKKKIVAALYGIEIMEV